jgi:hypothetical protein
MTKPEQEVLETLPDVMWQSQTQYVRVMSIAEHMVEVIEAAREVIDLTQHGDAQPVDRERVWSELEHALQSLDDDVDQLD